MGVSSTACYDKQSCLQGERTYLRRDAAFGRSLRFLVFKSRRRGVLSEGLGRDGRAFFCGLCLFLA